MKYDKTCDVTMGQEQGKLDGGTRGSSISQLRNKFRRRDGQHSNSVESSVPGGTCYCLLALLQ